MRHSIIKLLILFNFLLVDSYGQEIIANTCDSTLLTKKEYEKCKSDTAWTADILIKTNYIIKFKSDLLPKYRLIRRNFNVPPTLQKSLLQLKIIYDTVLNKKLSVFQTEMDRNQKYVQPKAYLSSLLSFHVLKFYPDIYAILLNEIHLQLTPKTTSEEQKKYKNLFNKTIKSIPTGLYQKLFKITDELNADNNKIMQQGVTKMFQGSIQEGYKSQCDIINFLLWAE
ncbi:MAG: hypothetical protein JWR72_1472 [Flavisolibacter sp.]|jgi:hypothetical protein|nr:hypothetical protein [Flavisolibacter sp.]